VESNESIKPKFENMKFVGQWNPYTPGMKITEKENLLLIVMTEGKIEVLHSRGAVFIESTDINLFIKSSENGGMHPTDFEHNIIAWCEIKVPTWTEVINYYTEEVYENGK
jgi:hypothetical protein